MDASKEGLTLKTGIFCLTDDKPSKSLKQKCELFRI